MGVCRGAGLQGSSSLVTGPSRWWPGPARELVPPAFVPPELPSRHDGLSAVPSAAQSTLVL